MKNLVILGAGTGGSILANLMTRKLDMKQWSVTVIDRAETHHYQPGYLFLPFGLYGYTRQDDVVKPISAPLPDKARFVHASIKLIDHNNKKVETSDGTFDYDWLILGLGCHIAPDEVEGMAEGMNKNIHNFYTLDGAMRLQEALSNMNEGKLVLNIAEMPIKCPVAPIEFVFLADYYFTKRGVRKNIEIELVTPLTGAFTKPLATKVLNKIAEEKNIKIIPDFSISGVDHEKGVISSFTGDTVDYDLMVAIPPNLGPDVIEDSGLGNGAGYAVTDEKTLKHTKADHIFVVGDNTNVPTSKAGSVAHFEAEVIEKNLVDEINGREPTEHFDGHSNCFIESGFHKALLFDFNYDTEPLPGTFPLGAIGPFSLLEETYINHWGKMAFRFVYWNLLLTGHLPGDPLLPARMSFTGKDLSVLKKDGHEVIHEEKETDSFFKD